MPLWDRLVNWWRASEWRRMVLRTWLAAFLPVFATLAVPALQDLWADVTNLDGTVQWQAGVSALWAAGVASVAAGITGVVKSLRDRRFGGEYPPPA